MFGSPSVVARVRARVAFVAAIALAASPCPAQDPPPRRACGATRLPASLPAADALVDSSMLVAVLSDAVAHEPDGLVISLLYADGQPLPTLTLLVPRSIASDSVERVLDVLRPNLKAVGPDGRRWAVRLHLRGGTNATLRVERAQFCPPMNVASTERATVTRRVVVRSGDMPPASRSSNRRLRIDADVFIDALGAVTDVQLRQGSGSPEVDDELLRVMRQRRYAPATVDGVAVPSIDRTNGGPIMM